MQIIEQQKSLDSNFKESKVADSGGLKKFDALSSGINADQTLGAIIAEDIRRTEVLNKYGLDFCCGGKKTLKDACTDKGLMVAVIESELQQVSGSLFVRDLPCNEWKAGFLADYIINTHHSYVKKMLPDIRSLALKVMTVHGKIHPEMLTILQLVEDINSELISHMAKEENILFPWIKKQEAAMKTEGFEISHFDMVKNPIAMMEIEHECVGKKLEQIRKLSENYILPADACSSYNLLYKLLANFEADLHIHIHLENNILFPKALRLAMKTS